MWKGLRIAMNLIKRTSEILSVMLGHHLLEDIQTELSRGEKQTLEIYDFLSGCEHKQLLKFGRQVLHQTLTSLYYLWPKGITVPC